MCLSDIVQMKGVQVFNRQMVCGGRRKRDDDLQIAPAPVANLYPRMAIPGVRVEEAQGMMIIVSAMAATQPGESPIRAALPASQVFLELVVLEFSQCCS
jgi:hypothetical protein